MTSHQTPGSGAVSDSREEGVFRNLNRFSCVCLLAPTRLQALSFLMWGSRFPILSRSAKQATMGHGATKRAKDVLFGACGAAGPWTYLCRGADFLGISGHREVGCRMRGGGVGAFRGEGRSGTADLQAVLSSSQLVFSFHIPRELCLFQKELCFSLIMSLRVCPFGSPVSSSLGLLGSQIQGVSTTCHLAPVSPTYFSRPLILRKLDTWS
jgi:hypothetical protein